MKLPITALVFAVTLMSFTIPSSLEDNQGPHQLNPPVTYYAYFVATSRDNQKRLITSPISYTVTEEIAIPRMSLSKPN